MHRTECTPDPNIVRTDGILKEEIMSKTRHSCAVFEVSAGSAQVEIHPRVKAILCLLVMGVALLSAIAMFITHVL
jgi:hypothetical protein